MSLQSRYYIQGRTLIPLGYEQITPTTVTALDPPDGTTVALIQAQESAIRWRGDGGDPTTDVGIRLNADEEFWYEGDLSAFRALDEGGSGAELNIMYYRYEV